MKITLSKTQWQQIGKKAGWIKGASFYKSYELDNRLEIGDVGDDGDIKDAYDEYKKERRQKRREFVAEDIEEGEKLLSEIRDILEEGEHDDLSDLLKANAKLREALALGNLFIKSFNEKYLLPEINSSNVEYFLDVLDWKIIEAWKEIFSDEVARGKIPLVDSNGVRYDVDKSNDYSSYNQFAQDHIEELRDYQNSLKGY